MPLRILLRYLGNNEALIKKLAESYPMRRAAQLTTYLYHKGIDIGEQTWEKVKETDERTTHHTKRLGTRASGFGRRLSAELKEGFGDLKEKMDKQKRNR